MKSRDCVAVSEMYRGYLHSENSCWILLASTVRSLVDLLSFSKRWVLSFSLLRNKTKREFYRLISSVIFKEVTYEMVMWSPSQTGGFSLGTLVSSHTKITRMQTLVPTSMINISCMNLFLIF